MQGVFDEPPLSSASAARAMASRDASAAAGAAAFAAAHASDRCAMTEEDPVDEDGRPVMTSRAVLRIVREAGGFTAPEMNDKLWLHNRRWRKIGGLEEFTGAAMLHLGNNHIGPDIGEGLRHLVHLKALHLPRNQIRGALDDNLRHNANLKLLDLSANRISRFPSGGLPPSLNTLLLVGNALEDAASIAPLAELPDLEVLDLKDNKLNGDALFELFPTFLSLKVLYLQGNPIQRAPNYRRKLVSRCAALTYLDAAPVEELEKCGAAAWAVGGADAEREARRRFLDEKTLARRAQTRRIAAERAARRSAAAAARETGDVVARGSFLFGEAVRVLAPAEANALRRRSPDPARLALGGVECPVCVFPFADGEDTIALAACGHSFHRACIIPWLTTASATCPVCRSEVRAPPPPRPADARGEGTDPVTETRGRDAGSRTRPDGSTDPTSPAISTREEESSDPARFASGAAAEAAVEEAKAAEAREGERPGSDRDAGRGRTAEAAARGGDASARASEAIEEESTAAERVDPAGVRAGGAAISRSNSQMSLGSLD